jgi:hypothetical protein
MKATMSWLGALLCAGFLAHSAQANYPCYPPRLAPDTCGPGFYSVNAYGAVYGPNYWVYPGVQPWNGFHPNCVRPKAGPAGPPVFPTHPFARSPRDYFMMD